MTSMLISLIAIVLFAVVITSAFLYFDADEASAIGKAPLAASLLGNLVEASEAFRQARGNYPLDMDDLRTEFEMPPVTVMNAEYVISDGVACLSLPYKQEVDDMLQVAKTKFAGSVVTDTCGSSGVTGRRFLAFSLDGANPPTASAFIPASIVSDPPGSIRDADGTVRYPDGTVRNPDGTIVDPDGTVRNPDGTEADPFETASTCNGMGAMPVTNDVQKANYIMAFGDCVEQRSMMTNRRLTSLADIGNPYIDYAAAGGGSPLIEENANGNIWFVYDVDNQGKCDSIGYRPNGSFSQSLENQCYWGYRVPRRYYKRLTDTYRPREQLLFEAGADAMTRSWLESDFRGTNTSTFRNQFNGIAPAMYGHALSNWDIIDDAGGRAYMRIQVAHEGFCTWFRQQKGYSSNKFDYSGSAPDYCWYSNGNGHFYQKQVTDQLRPKQIEFLESEAQKIVNAAIASGNVGGFGSGYEDVDGGRAVIYSGGYTPKDAGLTVGPWKLVSGTNGAFHVRVQVEKEGLCNWYRGVKGYSGNKFDYNSRSPDYCWYDDPRGHFYQLNVSQLVRAKQKSMIHSMQAGLQAGFDPATGTSSYATATNGVTFPNHPDVSTYVQINGRWFWRGQIDQGLCNYLYDETAATQNVSWNDLNHYYRPVMCQSVYRKGWYAMVHIG